ncbi:MAG TPA: septum formation protein Maf [Candidatus Scatovivens faecipullorum]|nr:septum formation protein Maf [Candidatus Scatovivens faecipullorum]
MKIILASQSPRRIALMELAKIDFEVMSSNKEEKKIKDGINIDEQSKEVAYQKALDVFNNTQGDRAIIGADTIVVKDNKVFGKPTDRKEAIKMLKELQNDVHTIYTSLAILIEEKGQYKEYKELVKTNVTVHSMTEQEIVEYVDTEEPYDKAGAYAIQSCFAKYIDEIEGNYMSVIGLPIDKIYKILKENEIL